MKRLIALCLSLMMALVLCACGEGTGGGAEGNVILKIGETAATNAAEFTLTEVEVDPILGDSYLLFTVVFSIKNIGDDALDDLVAFGEGAGSRLIANMVRVRYDRGYIYGFDEAYDDSKRPGPYLSIEPQTEAQMYSAVGMLPAEIQEPSKELVLEVALPNKRGKTVVFQYDLRGGELGILE